MVSLLFLSRGLRRKENNEKKHKREKRNEIQRMILLKSSLVVFIWTQICLKKEIFLNDCIPNCVNEFTL